MLHDQEGRTAVPSGRMRLSKNRVAITALALLAIFLAGFVPLYARTKNLEKELRAVRYENSLFQLRDLASLAYLQATQKDFGLAAGTNTRFFNRTREVASATENPEQKKAIESLMSLRDPMTARLAVADQGVVNDLHALLVKTREVTSVSSGSSQ